MESVAVAPTTISKPLESTKQISLGKEKEFRFEVDFGQKFIIRVIV